MPAPGVPTPTVRFTIPSVSVANGQTVVSPSVAVPIGVKAVFVHLNGSAWPVNTTVLITSEISKNNFATVFAQTTSTCTNVGSESDIYGGGFDFGSNGNQDSTLRIRGRVRVTGGAGITLVGTVSTL